ncbi:hypothetical protein AAFF_G00161920 [Aldrovandia affinis]|uniref:Uncharacterized protein n=1 Tax=Aldrovandia affinis TaxID=143900 RepID=A0AAD7W876_9TELE|nr:hypothetical protein AAFF_G00161920 [Aldrovandia affinis]
MSLCDNISPQHRGLENAIIFREVVKEALMADVHIGSALGDSTQDRFGASCAPALPERTVARPSVQQDRKGGKLPRNVASALRRGCVNVARALCVKCQARSDAKEAE